MGETDAGMAATEDHQNSPHVKHPHIKGAVEGTMEVVKVKAATVEAMEVKKDHHLVQAVEKEEVDGARGETFDGALVM